MGEGHRTSTPTPIVRLGDEKVVDDVADEIILLFTVPTALHDQMVALELENAVVTGQFDINDQSIVIEALSAALSLRVENRNAQTIFLFKDA